MKAKHLKIDEDFRLYDSIYREIKNKISFNPSKAKRYFLLKAIVYSILAIGSYAGLFFLENSYLFVLDYLLFGFVAVLLCFNFAHDLSHHALFKKPFWDNLFFEFIYTLVGAHPEAWKERHTHSHHFAPNVKNFDTDLAITGLIRELPNAELRWYHKYQHIYAVFAYMTYSFYWVFIKDFLVLKRFSPVKKSQKARYYGTFAGLKLFYLTYLLFLPLFFSHQSVWLVIGAFFVMHMVQSVYTLFTFFITHHVEKSEYPVADETGQINTSWFKNQIRSSNDFYPFSFGANFLFGGVNNHIAHHLFPHISHYYYPEVNTILFKRLREAGIEPNVTTYFGGVLSHLSLLRSRGQGK